MLAHRVIASTITTLMVAHRGVHFLMPFVPMELMTSLPNTSDVEPPGPPVHSDHYQTNLHVKCTREWTYLMCLLQYWYDAGSVYTCGGPVLQESKLMLFVYYRINAMLNLYSIFIRLHEIMDNMPWRHFYQERTLPEDCIADCNTHRHVISSLDLWWNWLKNHHLAEANEDGNTSSSMAVRWTGYPSRVHTKINSPVTKALSTATRASNH